MSDASTATLADVVRLLRDLLQLQTRQPAELLDREGMAAVLAIGVSTLDRLRAAGKIGPRPLDLAGVKYDRREVLAWLAHRDPAGELLDSRSWPAVWASLQAKTKTR